VVFAARCVPPHVERTIAVHMGFREAASRRVTVNAVMLQTPRGVSYLMPVGSIARCSTRRVKLLRRRCATPTSLV
jgi:hypothetical protein